MAAKLTRLTHKITIQLHLVAESCTICSSPTRRLVRKLLDTLVYYPVYYAAHFECDYKKQPSPVSERSKSRTVVQISNTSRGMAVCKRHSVFCRQVYEGYLWRADLPLPLSCATCIQSTSSQHKIHFNNILPSMPRCSEWSLPFRFAEQNFVCIVICYAC